MIALYLTIAALALAVSRALYVDWRDVADFRHAIQRTKAQRRAREAVAQRRYDAAAA